MDRNLVTPMRAHVSHSHQTFPLEKDFFQPFCKNVRKLFVRVDTTNGSVAIQIDLSENAISVDTVHS